MQKKEKTTQSREREEYVLSVMERTKLNIYRQAGLAGLAIVVTVVLCFAMTVAWYSNIIHTGDMTFKASEWDFTFEGEVIVGEEDGVVSASPGDSGIVTLSVANDSGNALGVITNVLKSALSEEMQKRIFFYADTPMTANGETTERTYISTEDSYTYKLLPGNTLVLSDTYCNDVPLKWEWVYDVLGYYVRGTVSTMSDNTQIISLDDYIRPVTYEYEAAEYDSNGNLASINGYTKDEILTQLYCTDGYAGSEVGTMVNGYYPVDVDVTGYGVWLYLCNESEIQAANEWDFALGSQEEKQSFSVKLLLTGMKVEESTVDVGTVDDLVTALSSGTDRVILPADLTVPAEMVIQIPEGVDTILDLNGHTLDSNKVGNLIHLSKGSKLTVMNGTLDLAGNNGYEPAITVNNATLTMKNVTLEGAEEGIEIDDSGAVSADSRVYIDGCNMVCSDVPLVVWGNGTVDTGKTTVIVENSTLHSESYVGIMGNGSVNKGGTNIQIIKSNVSGYYAGIYQPQQNSELVVQSSTITGYTGIAIKGGDVLVDNSQIYGTGASVDPQPSMSGWSDTGDGIYVEDNYGVNISVVIAGEHTTVKSDNRYAVECFEPNSDHVSIVIKGGTFVSSSAYENHETYNGDIAQYLANGYISVKVADGSYQVDPAPAEINE